jgi:F-type H+-transporting ATPase subunit epsilon
MAGLLNVEVVTPEKRLWSGEAKSLSARTVEGDIGILPNHSEILSVLVDGAVKVVAADGSTQEFTVRGGFLSVAKNRVSVLGEAE